MLMLAFRSNIASITVAFSRLAAAVGTRTAFAGVHTAASMEAATTAWLATATTTTIRRTLAATTGHDG